MDKAKEESASEISSSSRHSNTTTSSMRAAAKARAVAEAARVRALYAQREAKLKLEQAEREARLTSEQAEREARQKKDDAHNILEKARTDVELETLAVEREAAVASAQAEVLEAADGENRSQRSKHGKKSSKHDIDDRTSAYVEQQIELKSEFITSPDGRAPLLDSSLITWGTPYVASECSPTTTKHVKIEEHTPVSDLTSPKTPPHANKTPVADHTPSNAPPKANNTPVSDHKPSITLQYVPQANNTHQEDNKQHAKPQVKLLNPSAQYYTPLRYSTTSDPIQTPGMADFVKYLARRELVTTSLNQFDDQPESFRAWQSSFLNAIRGLDLSPSEELDLLTKWLGKESSNHVRRMRQVHVNNPGAALRKAWDRLSECYASPEVIENALFKKLDMFPRISSKDHIKLRELGDLLMEIQSAKEDGYLCGLSYLDNARGILPIVEKLPHALQEKWLYQGSRFKEEHGGRFPPFSFFTNFICYEAHTRNDPSFALPSNSNPPTKDKPVHQSERMSVHKTEISPDTEPDKSTSPKQVQDPEKDCPIHHKPHPLRKCREFRAKPLDDRKTFLREHGICYKCCASNSHLAKDCKATIKCSECESDRHITAMHLGPAPKAQPVPNTTPEHNEEEEDPTSSTTVNSHCTEVCGNGQPAMSCSKICLVQVFPEGQRDKAVTMYTILDDQSNRSLAKPEFFELFDVKSHSSPYSLSTCAGVIKTSGRKAEGFHIEPVNGGDTLALPPLIECSQIPSNRSEIPTPKAALLHPHLKSVAGHIPELDPNAQILLLLGRDIARVHKVRQHINGPGNAPFAQRLDLGWVVIGEVCLGNAQKPNTSTFKTHVLENGHPSCLTPCNSFTDLEEKVCHGGEQPKPNLERATEQKPADRAPRAVSASHFAKMQESFKLISPDMDGKTLPKSIPLFELNPVHHEHLMRNGSRLKCAPAEKNPLVLPEHNYVSTLLARHHHKLGKHQGRKWVEDRRNLQNCCAVGNQHQPIQARIGWKGCKFKVILRTCHRGHSSSA